jgi:hypothetical protein
MVEYPNKKFKRIEVDGEIEYPDGTVVTAPGGEQWEVVNGELTPINDEPINVESVNIDEGTIDNVTLSQSQLSNLTYHTGTRVAVGDTAWQTIFDVSDPTDIVSGYINGAQTRNVTVTFDDGSESIITASALPAAEDDAGNTMSDLKLPPVRNVTKLEFQNWNSTTYYYGWEVITI